MKFSIKSSTLEASPDEREMMTLLGNSLDHLTDTDKKNIDAILAYNLESAKNDIIIDEIRKSLSSTLSVFLSHQDSVLLLNLIMRTQNIDKFLDSLKDENIFSGRSNHFIIELSSKFGLILRAIVRGVDEPLRWTNIESDIVLSDDEVFLQTKISRGDAKSFIINIPFEDTIMFSNHFIKKTLDTCKKVDKEHVLEISEKSLENLIKNLDELKTLYDTVKNETNVPLNSEQG